jgi:hypothetical protein
MSKENFEKFKNAWEKEINKIENNVIDSQGAWLIYNRFSIDVLNLLMSMSSREFTWDMSLEKSLLESKLTRALEIARTKYKLESRSLWVRILESIKETFIQIPKFKEIKPIKS